MMISWPCTPLLSSSPKATLLPLNVQRSTWTWSYSTASPQWISSQTPNLFRTFAQTGTQFRFIAIIALWQWWKKQILGVPLYTSILVGLPTSFPFIAWARKFRVTYDSADCGSVFKVHTSQGLVKFKPTPKGLNALNLQQNLEAAFLLVNDMEL